jgi:hypothetical protein
MQGVESPHDINEERWVLTNRAPGRCFLGGNAHTHPGHIHAWSEELGALVTIRKDDVTEASPLARAWIDGFLVGNEPDFADWLGVPWEEADEHYHADDPMFAEWTDDLRRFRQRGWIPLRSGDDEAT